VVVDQHECYTYQIKPQEAKLKMREFYCGNLYQDTWIKKAISKSSGNVSEIGGN